jgi:hypothetical protein
VVLVVAMALVGATLVGMPAADAGPADGGWTVDAYGGVHAFGGAPAARGGSYWPGRDVARGIAANDEGPGGWVLDAFGGLHPFGGAPRVVVSAYWSGWDIARGIAVNPTGPGGWVLDGWGGLHPFGGAPAVAPGGYWPGRDVARGIATAPGGGGWVVDAFGGVHAFGGAPVVRGGTYWPGWDIARGIAGNPTGPGGWVLDGWGGLHPFGGAPAVASGGYWSGWDIARGVLARVDGGGWVLDAWGGLHAFGGAPRVTPTGYWPGQDLARGVGGASGASGYRVPPRVKARTVPIVRVFTYSISVRGAVHSNLSVFTDAVAATLRDERSWAGAGIEFVQVPSGGDFSVVLTQDALMPSYGSPCSRFWSCRQGRYVAINDDRFDWGSPYWPGPVSEYRHMVIDHEVGHWLGFGHAGCGGAGQLAPVMMQQSKGLQGCAPNPWPLPSEIAREKANIGARFDPLDGGPTTVE